MSESTDSFASKAVNFASTRKLQVAFAFILVAMFGLLFYWAIWPNDAPGWTGFGARSETGSMPRTVWEWMELLLIPVALIVGVWLWGRTSRQINLENASLGQAQSAIETFTERMTNLILVQGLRDSQEGDEVRTVARALTATVLRNVDSARKGQVVEFLYESSLLDVRDPVLALRKLQLTVANLAGYSLTSASLQGADLRYANLQAADLSTSDLRATQLNGANLSRVWLQEAYLRSAKLDQANLKEAHLYAATLTKASLVGADLRSANLEGANLSNADLSGANLSGANLRNAKLRGAILREANLEHADLRLANLSHADLESAILNNATLEGANLSRVSLTNASLRTALFGGAVMNDVGLTGADLRKSNLG